jgi:hypothetical protein
MQPVAGDKGPAVARKAAARKAAAPAAKPQ